MLSNQGRRAAYKIAIEDLRTRHPRWPLLELRAWLAVIVLQIRLIGQGRLPWFVRVIILILAHLVAFLIADPLYWALAGAVLIGRWLFGKRF